MIFLLFLLDKNLCKLDGKAEMFFFASLLLELFIASIPCCSIPC